MATKNQFIPLFPLQTRRELVGNLSRLELQSGDNATASCDTAAIFSRQSDNSGKKHSKKE